jgi:hypothetical protein
VQKTDEDKLLLHSGWVVFHPKPAIAIPILVFWKVTRIALGSFPTRRDVRTIANDAYLRR